MKKGLTRGLVAALAACGSKSSDKKSKNKTIDDLKMSFVPNASEWIFTVWSYIVRKSRQKTPERRFFVKYVCCALTNATIGYLLTKY